MRIQLVSLAHLVFSEGEDDDEEAKATNKRNSNNLLKNKKQTTGNYGYIGT